ncbi:Mitochondrial cardiolipin hydrolase [Halotydeus destructor]|nr:Mitochondrial cardiolipin hydrolase [Halotydeus destructor]
MSRWISLVVEGLKYVLIAEALYMARRYFYATTVKSQSRAIQCGDDNSEQKTKSSKDDIQSGDDSGPWSEEECWDDAPIEKKKEIVEDIYPINKVLFFPDTTIIDPGNNSLPSSKKTFYEARSTGSFRELARVLRSTRKSLDLALYIVAFPPLADIILTLKKRGVVIRMIVDSRENEAAMSQINQLKKRGIVVRSNPHSYSVLMHHKFAIIDGRILLNGSFNWTRAAVLQNYDNVMITSVPTLVSMYEKQFEEMWLKFVDHVPKTTPDLQDRIRSARTS